MKGKVALIALVLVSAFLVVFLVVSHRKAQEEQQQAEWNISRLSNDLNQTTLRLTEQQHVNTSLTNTLGQRVGELLEFSNKFVSITAELTRTEQQAAAAAKNAEQEMAKRDAKISELEGQNDEMTRKMVNLNAVLTDLEKQIAETERKLAASEGDREFLMAELKRLQAEKAELERQMTDLAALRDQIRKLKDELSIARRLEWIRRGLYGAEQRGAEKLEAGHATPAQPGYDLDVEIRQDGGARVVPRTNPPAAPTNP